MIDPCIHKGNGWSSGGNNGDVSIIIITITNIIRVAWKCFFFIQHEKEKDDERNVKKWSYEGMDTGLIYAAVIVV